MEIKTLQIILTILCLISIGPIAIFFKRKNTEDIYNLIKNYDNITKNNLEQINQGNKKIDEIEKKILQCKIKLKMKKFDK